MIFNPPFIKKLASAGEPLSAQAWNDIVNALGQVHTHLESIEATALKVQITTAGVDLSTVRVTALRDDGIAIDAMAPVLPATVHTFAGLRAGAYSLRVQTPGYNTATLNVTAPEAAVQNVTLTANGAFMPQVFGQVLSDALAQLSSAQITVARILDVTGTDVPTANPGAQYASSRVLMQVPYAGTPVPTGQSVQLVIAAALQAQSSVEIPPLTGLSLAEAQKALEGLGLVLGNVLTKQTAG